MNSILSLAQQYLAQDKDPVTHAEVQALVDAAGKDEYAEAAKAELERRLRPRIAFGTAGLRARMQAGYARMNGLTVIQASQGLAAYVLEQAGRSDAAAKPSVVVGRDARHNSEKFARLAAAAFLARGLQVIWFSEPVHTPMVPFAVKHHGASAGIVVTASHNPKDDNGYKVYWGNGCQIIPPHDAGIAQAIDSNLEPLSWDDKAVNAVDTSHEQETKTAYFRSIQKLQSSLISGAIRVPPCVYTPLHGVGRKPLERVIGENFKFTPDRNALAIVREQAMPDPNFPTVKFPNPEESGALDLAFAKADEQGDNLVIANDPDADRFAAAEKNPSTGEWHQFTGNEVGMLLATFMWETCKAKDPSKCAMLNTTVSTGWLKAMAAAEGFQYRETLTGFKWLGNVAQELAAQGIDVLFAFEEALGYMFPQVVHDKDGVSTACVFLAAAATWQKQGVSLLQKLETSFQKYGYFADANTYLIRKDPEVTPKIFADIRGDGNPAESHPKQLGGRKILRWRDLTTGFDSASADGVPDLPVDKSSQMITCELEGRTRFTVRGSGTEPKIKLYIESSAMSADAAKLEAKMVQRDLIEQWFNPGKYGLTLPGS